MTEAEPIDYLGEEPADSEKLLGAFPNPDVGLSPVVPLGFDGAKVIFAMPEGEIRRELASKIGQMLRTDIYACQAGQSFLSYWRDKDDKFQRELATVWFNRACREAGKWDPNRPVRSLGVWPGGQDSEGRGGVVLHRGEEIIRYADGKDPVHRTIAEALKVKRGPLYQLRPPAPEAGRPCSKAAGRWIRRQLDWWRFEDIGEDGLTGADIIAGWLAASLLGAAAPFRGHVLLHALQGSGKSTFLEFCHALLSALAGEIVSSFSEAGFRADLSGLARPNLLDEAEAGGSDGPGAVEQVLTLLRLMSTGAGARRLQSDNAGGVMTQTAVGTVMMVAITPPKLDAALSTRVVALKLRPLTGTDLGPDEEKPRLATRRQLARITRHARALAPHLLGRVLENAGRYRDDVSAVVAALVEEGEEPRNADLMAMLAAGRRLLIEDDPLTPEGAVEEARRWRPLLAERQAREVVSNVGAEALAHLMGWNSGQHRGDRHVTIGELINTHLVEKVFQDEPLKAHGLQIYQGPGKDGREGPWLFVSNNHPVLDRIYGKTRWRDYRTALEYLDELGPEHRTWATKPLRFGVGIKQRALAIPLAPWLDKPFSRSRGVPGTVPGQADE
ncbi:MAG: hypothetical protein DI552_00210 [Brevundimonas sp.]|uniref:hypothetical protein n=1 Tax=Brevundimonas sp. TaxID=1871086 RepID=UPI000DBC0CAE|nr:hypothetical protein [Brevundimonas sp.]PZU62327.1 MAG: hypothetical protein DI552_00210 [Brevundimonas sp.]